MSRLQCPVESIFGTAVTMVCPAGAVRDAHVNIAARLDVTHGQGDVLRATILKQCEVGNRLNIGLGSNAELPAVHQRALAIDAVVVE
jgi:hypothetical protein